MASTDQGTTEMVQVLSLQAVDLGGHDEVALGEAVNFVRPHRDLGFAPGQENVGMVALLLGHRSHTIHEIERLLEVRKCVGASEMVPVDHVPLGNVFVQGIEFPALEWRHSAATGHALLVG
jgi:hypothetical protein